MKAISFPGTTVIMGCLIRTCKCQRALGYLIAALGLIIWSLWLGVNSDKDNIHPILNHLIPAGHCACESATIFKCESCLQGPVQSYLRSSSGGTFNSDYLGLNETECQSIFPGLFQDLLRAKSFWLAQYGIRRDNLDSIQVVDGMARAAIFRGKLYVIEVRAKGEDHRRKIMGILSSIYRALTSAPDLAALPNIEFAFSVEDKVEDVLGSSQQHPLWVLARKATEESVWLMPDFGLWAWENDNFNSSIGPYDQVVEHVRQNEPPWSNKKAQLIWRGKLSFAPKLRRTLLEAARNQPWGDVKEVEWGNKANFVSMEDHCSYRLIAHVEGIIGLYSFAIIH